MYVPVCHRNKKKLSQTKKKFSNMKFLLRFIKEFLRTILTIAVAEVFFLGSHHSLEFAECELMNFIGAVLNHPGRDRIFRRNSF